MMTNKLENSDYSSAAFVTNTSRYANNPIIFYTVGNQRRITFETYKRGTYKSSSQDRYTIVPAGWQYRPDKASLAVYGTPDFWWKIMEANGIFDVYDFKAGVNIRIPANPY
jgi:hypothetical protein